MAVIGSAATQSLRIWSAEETLEHFCSLVPEASRLLFERMAHDVPAFPLSYVEGSDTRRMITLYGYSDEYRPLLVVSVFGEAWSEVLDATTLARATHEGISTEILMNERLARGLHAAGVAWWLDQHGNEPLAREPAYDAMTMLIEDDAIAPGTSPVHASLSVEPDGAFFNTFNGSLEGLTPRETMYRYLHAFHRSLRQPSIEMDRPPVNDAGIAGPQTLAAAHFYRTLELFNIGRAISAHNANFNLPHALIRAQSGSLLFRIAGAARHHAARFLPRPWTDVAVSFNTDLPGSDGADGVFRYGLQLADWLSATQPKWSVVGTMEIDLPEIPLLVPSRLPPEETRADALVRGKRLLTSFLGGAAQSGALSLASDVLRATRIEHRSLKADGQRLFAAARNTHTIFNAAQSEAQAIVDLAGNPMPYGHPRLREHVHSTIHSPNTEPVASPYESYALAARPLFLLAGRIGELQRLATSLGRNDLDERLDDVLREQIDVIDDLVGIEVLPTSVIRDCYAMTFYGSAVIEHADARLLPTAIGRRFPTLARNPWLGADPTELDLHPAISGRSAYNGWRIDNIPQHNKLAIGLKRSH